MSIELKPFKDRFSKKVISEAERYIGLLLKDSVKFHKDRHGKEAPIINGKYSVRVNDPDYCNAFGILQGLYLTKGYTSSGSCIDAYSPRCWFEELENKYLAAPIKE